MCWSLHKALTIDRTYSLPLSPYTSSPGAAQQMYERAERTSTKLAKWRQMMGASSLKRNFRKWFLFSEHSRNKRNVSKDPFECIVMPIHLLSYIYIYFQHSAKVLKAYWGISRYLHLHQHRAILFVLLCYNGGGRLHCGSVLSRRWKGWPG